MSACRSELDGPPSYDPVLLQWIRDQYEQGALIVSLCTGSYLLAETGLLDGLPATCHWASASHFQQCYPSIRLQSKKPFVVTGDGGRLIVAGTGTYHHNLTIYLIQRMIGPEEAHRFARISGKFWTDDSQDVYARLSAEYNHTDHMVQEAQRWVSENLAWEKPVQSMAERAFLTEKTFTRRFKAATGYTPLSYVQAVRIERARHLLEASRVPVHEIAFQVGYNDARAFRRLFNRTVGMTSADYRKGFKLPPSLTANAEEFQSL